MGFLNPGKLMVGYDIGNDFVQLSYCVGDGEVETLSSVAGEESYNVPMVLCKRQGANQWFYGKEALRMAEDGEGILVENLLKLALDGEPVQIDGTTFEPIALLTLFVKRSLGMLSQVAGLEKLAGMMFTCEKPDARMIEVLQQVVKGMHLKTDKVFYQSHAESFYHYVIKQSKELWQSRVLLLEYRGTRVQAYCMDCNRRTTPVVCSVDAWEHSMLPYEPMPEDEELKREKMERLDREFAELASLVCKNTAVSSVYLIGEHYSDEWMKESLRTLCMGRRVFQGNNLYSKGACMAMQERLRPSEVGKAHVFLGQDKLKVNIGMYMFHQGEETYVALMDAGINWYEAVHEFEFYQRGDNELELQLTSLMGGESRMEKITLEDMLPGMSRMKAKLYLTGEKNLVLEVEDLGFGSFRPATHQVWRKEIAL